MKKILTALTFIGAVTLNLLAADQRPNIIFFLSDDYGLDGVSCYGSDTFKTPNIDALAKAGLRFENAYCTPLCGPTRSLFNTGRYGFRTGGISNGSWRPGGPGPTSRDEVGIAKMLKQAGYATGHCGKWRQVGETPGDWGFDEYITDPTAGGWYWQNSYTKNGQLVQSDKEVYCPDVCHDFALDFINRHKDKPFFFYYASHLVHGPILRTPDTKPGTTDPQALYADNVNYLDKQLGDLVAYIDKLGLRGKTLIIFTGDNGTAGASRTLKGRALSGQKASMMDCGAHVPFIASWKGTAPEGKVIKDLTDFSDMFPTFAELAGGKMPAGVTYDSRSLAPQLRGQPGNPRDWIFVQLGARWYVREMAWKLNQQAELFDMTDAPFVEKLIPADTKDNAAVTARKRLQSVLDSLNPAGGKTESADAGKAKTGKKRAGKKQKRAKE